MTTPSALSLRERFDLFPAGLSILGTILYSALTGIFRGKKGAKTYRVHVFRGIIHKLVVRLSLRQTQYLMPSTDKGYQSWARGKKEPESVLLKHGAVGHWIGDKNAKNVLIYYHGGGFALPAAADHFTYLTALLNNLNNKAGKNNDNDIAIFFLAYTLTPTAVYPTQLTQAVEALRYILAETNAQTQTPRAPANVFVAGDSAGGNLALAVLLHLTHPHPEIDPLAIGNGNGGERLGGVIAIAPWVSFRTDWPSMQDNKSTDLITVGELEKWGSAYLASTSTSTGTSGGRQGEPWSEPLLAPAEWWGGFRAKGLLVMAGGGEILLSSIEVFVEKLRADGKKDVTFVVGEGETHVPMAYGGELHTQQGRELEGWLSLRLN